MSLIIKGLCKTYNNGKKELVVLDNINLEIERGKLNVILGPSGCGKTTLLNVITGLVKPARGKINFENEDIFKSNHKIGVVFQEPRLFPWLKVSKNIAFGLKNGEREKNKEIVLKYIKLVGLENFIDFFPDNLSGGMKQRVAIARALAIDPVIILMDEPFSALDLKTRETMQDLLRKVQNSINATILFVTHNVEEAVYLADNIFIFSALPSKVITEIKSELPKERCQNIKIQNCFIELENLVNKILREN